MSRLFQEVKPSVLLFFAGLAQRAESRGQRAEGAPLSALRSPLFIYVAAGANPLHLDNLIYKVWSHNNS